ncbi:DNA alkylation repair enzyme [compost metagenome]
MEKTMREQVKEQLLGLVDQEYQKFSTALIPNIDKDTVLGVRLPELRKIAKSLAKDDWRAYLQEALNYPEKEYFEEIMIQGMLIGYLKADIEEILQYVGDFVPKINNWSVCDSFCIGLKFTNKNKDKVWSFLKPYLSSTQEYELRFGIVMLLNFFVDEEHIDEVLRLLNHIEHDGYYVKMAVAWALSISFIKLPEQTMVLLRDNSLDDFTYNKALQKITESYRIDQDTKMLIRGMKRKVAKG